MNLFEALSRQSSRTCVMLSLADKNTASAYSETFLATPLSQFEIKNKNELRNLSSLYTIVHISGYYLRRDVVLTHFTPIFITRCQRQRDDFPSSLHFDRYPC